MHELILSTRIPCQEYVPGYLFTWAECNQCDVMLPWQLGWLQTNVRRWAKRQPHIFSVLSLNQRKDSSKWISYFTLFKWLNRTQLGGYYLSAIMFFKKKYLLLKYSTSALRHLWDLLSSAGGRLSFGRTAERHSHKLSTLCICNGQHFDKNWHHLFLHDLWHFYMFLITHVLLQVDLPVLIPHRNNDCITYIVNERFGNT